MGVLGLFSRWSFCFVQPLPPESPLLEIPHQVPGLPEGGLQAAMGGAVPCVDGSILGHEVGFALREHLLGEVGILHIHEVVLVKAAHGLEGCGIHRREAAGAELDLNGSGQILPLHQIRTVIFLPEFQKRRAHSPPGFVCKNQSEISKLDLSMLSRMIRRCCEIKAGVVERDPKEQGERALLNLGHTVGHAVEKMKNFQLLHGQCVGVGLIAAAYLSMQRGLLTEEEYEEIRKGCHSYNLPLSVDSLNAGDVLAATKKDKKMEAGHIKFILMDGIGKSFIDKTVTDEELLQAIREILI